MYVYKNLFIELILTFFTIIANVPFPLVKLLFGWKKNYLAKKQWNLTLRLPYLDKLSISVKYGIWTLATHNPAPQSLHKV